MTAFLIILGVFVAGWCWAVVPIYFREKRMAEAINREATNYRLARLPDVARGQGRLRPAKRLSRESRPLVRGGLPVGSAMGRRDDGVVVGIMWGDIGDSFGSFGGGDSSGGFDGGGCDGGGGCD